MKQSYFIFDCNDQIVGNLKGYPTFKGANIQANKPESKAFNAIWSAYDQAKKLNPEHTFIHSIRFLDFV